MIRLFMCIIGFVLYPSSYGICESFYPGSGKWDVIYWDNVRHVLYIFGIVLAYSILFTKPNPRYDKYSKAIVINFIWSMAIPAIIGKLNHDDGFKWYDIPFVIVGLYSSACELYPKLNPFNYVRRRSKTIK